MVDLLCWVERGPFWELSSEREPKDLPLAYALWALSIVGICGLQRMYLGQTLLGFAMLFTFGFCGIGQILDLFLLPNALNQQNHRFRVLKDVPVVLDPAATTSGPASQRVTITKQSAQDDEMDQLLRQAEKSVFRIEQLGGDC